MLHVEEKLTQMALGMHYSFNTETVLECSLLLAKVESRASQLSSGCGHSYITAQDRIEMTTAVAAAVAAQTHLLPARCVSTCDILPMTYLRSNLSLRFSMTKVFDFLLLTSIAPKLTSLGGVITYLSHTTHSILTRIHVMHALTTAASLGRNDNSSNTLTRANRCWATCPRRQSQAVRGVRAHPIILLGTPNHQWGRQ